MVKFHHIYYMMRDQAMDFSGKQFLIPEHNFKNSSLLILVIYKTAHHWLKEYQYLLATNPDG